MVGLCSNLKLNPTVAASAKQSWTQQGLGRKAEFPTEQREALLLLIS